MYYYYYPLFEVLVLRVSAVVHSFVTFISGVRVLVPSHTYRELLIVSVKLAGVKGWHFAKFSGSKQVLSTIVSGAHDADTGLFPAVSALGETDFYDLCRLDDSGSNVDFRVPVDLEGSCDSGLFFEDLTNVGFTTRMRIGGNISESPIALREATFHNVTLNTTWVQPTSIRSSSVQVD
jgi:hypothetical protein